MASRPCRTRGTLALSWGEYGGFYLCRHRICLGWVALTLVPNVEIEDLMQAYIETAPVKRAEMSAVSAIREEANSDG